MKNENSVRNKLSIGKDIVIKQIKFKGSLENYPRERLQVDFTEEGIRDSLEKRKYELHSKVPVKLIRNSNPASLIQYILNTDHNYTEEEAILTYKFIQEVIYKYRNEYPDSIKLGKVSFFFFHDLLNNLKRTA